MIDLDILKAKVMLLSCLLDDPNPWLSVWVERLNELREDIGIQEKPQWFTTDKPPPDGRYWWRSDSSSDEESVIITVENGSFMYYLLTDVKQGRDHLYRIKLDRDFSGEWCPIKFP